jgi:hypothetical protein
MRLYYLLKMTTSQDFIYLSVGDKFDGIPLRYKRALKPDQQIRTGFDRNSPKIDGLVIIN